jgi:ketosteroid isomerase-like protein
MSTQTKLTDAVRVAIEKEITELYKKWMKTAENVDTSSWADMSSDAYGLGMIDSGLFYKSSKDVLKDFEEGFKLLERQEILATPEFHLAVLAPDVVVGTELTKTAAYYKDGKVFTGNFAHTMVFVKIDGVWKLIHFHQSVQPVE